MSFEPKFPRSVSGGDYRIPLDHPDAEAVAKRADRAYREFPLSEDDRARLIARYKDLAEASAYLWGAIGDRRIEDNGLRPASIRAPVIEAAKAEAGHTMARNIGFVFRCRDYVQRIEDVVGFTAYVKFGEIANRDDDGEVYDAETGKAIGDPMPGDDI